MPLSVLVTSYVFPPRVGGIERATLSLARMLAAAGHRVTVVTMEPGPWTAEASEPYRVVRLPSPHELMALVHAADAVVVNNPSFRLQWPLAVVRRPSMTVLHAPWETGSLRHRVTTWLKVQALRTSTVVVAVSRAVAERTPVRTVVIPNTYDASAFAGVDDVPRDPHGVVFLGRLIEQKGADLLIDAVALLRDAGRHVRCTVVGDGPERGALEERARRLGVEDRVVFRGALAGRRLVEALRTQTVLAVPSRGHEPFGIVALEGLAAGCAVVVAAAGGPEEAVGPAGLVVPTDDAPALASAVRRLLDDSGLRERLAHEAVAHLARHSPETVGAEYDALLRRIARR